jgi:hypothetical protein
MITQDTIAQLIRAIPEPEIQAAARGLIEETLKSVVELLARFASAAIVPEAMHELEVSLEQLLRSLGRKLLEWLLNELEPEVVEDLPATIVHREKRYRRLSEKSQRHNILSRFGNVSLERAMYRRGSRGKTISPLEKSLGIIEGFTPAAADWIGRQAAAPGASQKRNVDAIEERMGTRIGHEKLRKLTRNLAWGLEEQREPCQRAQLLEWIEQARKGRKTPVLSISRDGVSLGIQPYGFFEMAGVATVSVMSKGQRLGTVYLACAPEENQQTLSDKLTELLKNTIRDCGKRIPELVYVTDAGKIETAYWKNTLRTFFVDGQRIKVTRVLDYYHVSSRLTTIADALRTDPKVRREWLKRTGQLLREPGGWGRVIRSIAAMKKRCGYSRAAAQDARKAEKYLRRYRRYMNYCELQANDYPIGSGVVESACKQIVTERMKLSGMRWARAGADCIMTLRSILLSQTWAATFKKMLESQSSSRLPVNDLIDSLAPGIAA